MSAFLFIQGKRKTLERIELVTTLQLAMRGSKRDYEKTLGRWAREAEINITFEE